MTTDTTTPAPVMGDPGPTGRFGDFGGRYVPEALVPACIELEAAFRDAWADPAFRSELDGILRGYGGPSDAGDRSAAGCRTTSACGCC